MSKLSKKEELDFCYLLALLPLLKKVPEYAWLPELFSIIGHKSLIDLCRFAGGETIKIPTLEELNTSIQSLQWYYSVFIRGKSSVTDIPPEYAEETLRILKYEKVGK